MYHIQHEIILRTQGDRMRDKENTKALWTRPFLFLIIVSLLTTMGFNMVYVMISNYAMAINGSLAIAGIIAGIFSISALLVRPLAGMSVDRFNKKHLCIIANILIGVAALGYALSDQIPMLFFFRVLHGVAFGLSSTTNIALVTEYIPKERMGEGIGYYGIGQVISQIIGPNLGVYIADSFGFQPMFLIITLLSFIAAVMLLFLPYSQERSNQNDKKIKITINSLIAKEVIVYSIIGGMFSFSNGIVSSFLILLGKERQIANVGLFFSVGAIVLFGMRIFIGRVIDKQGLTLVVNISLIITAVSMMMIGVVPVLSWLIIASVLKSMGQGSGQISLQTECIKRVDASRVGVATSTFYIGADIGQGLGPIIGGKITDCFNYMVMYFTCAALIIGAMIVFNLYQNKTKSKSVSVC